MKAHLSQRHYRVAFRPLNTNEWNHYFFEISDKIHKLCFATKSTKLYSKMILVKSSESNFVFLSVFHLVMWLMKTSKNFGKITILKIWEPISLGRVISHFGKLMMHLQARLISFCCYYVIVLDRINNSTH